MGVWGNGNFESDDAVEVLIGWIHKMIEEIEATFILPIENIFSGEGEAKIVANIDIVSNLLSIYGVVPDLETETVISWKEQYLKAFDMSAKERILPEGIAFAQHRRDVIVTTFDEFINQLRLIRSEC